MGADCVAAWLGGIVLAVLSFVPANMAPDYNARFLAGRAAEFSLLPIGFTVLWTTLYTMQLAPPQGGVFGSCLSALLLVPAALSAWGLGLLASRALRSWFGLRLPHLLTLLLGAGSVAMMLVVR